MVLSKDDLIKKIRVALGDDHENLIEIVEDVSDTIDGLSDDAYKVKYEELRNKYISRFTSGEIAGSEEGEEVEEETELKTYDDLFEKEDE